MELYDVKINGITNPVGFSFPRVKCSWKVRGTADTKAARVKITVAEEAAMEHPVKELEGEALPSIGTELKLDLKPRTRYYVAVEVWGNGGDHGKSDVCFFETGKMDEPWEADFIGTQEEEDTVHPVFAKSFQVREKVSRACIYVTGLGLYEAYLNGGKIGNDYLAPFCNDYNKAVQYQTYDVTDMLSEDNTLSILTGNGWYKGRLGYDGDAAVYGNRFGTIAELHIDYENGAHEVVKTDDSWKYRMSAILSSDIYDGEWIDALRGTAEQDLWKAAVIQPFDKAKLTGRYSIPVVVKRDVPVADILHTPAGETVLDMGQNFAGYLTFYSRLAAGTKVELQYGEILQQGNFYRDNYRTAKAKFTYISDGTEGWIRPHFTFYGFRYVKITGWEGELRREDFVGKAVYSDLEETVSFESPDKKLNRLYQNVLWGQRSNFLDMPTDCPQRDERLGWTGDAQVFSPTASFQMDTRAFYRKFLYDLHLDQMQHEGAVANFIPNLANLPGGSSVWGDVATFVPMTLYDYYGDLDELADHYPMMRDWVEFIIRGDIANGGHDLWDFGFHFGDWLAQDGITPQSMKGGTDDFYVASMYYYASVKKVARAARLLGKTDDETRYEAKAAKIRTAILKEYFSENGRLAIDTQTGYLLALKFGVYVDKKRVIDGLKLRLKKDCYKIKGGFVGATMMCQVMAANGMQDMAYYILFQEGFPGWMHCINLGATTIWERWNSVLDDGSISGTGMNSLNHYSYGSVMEFVYRYIAGVNELAPGFTKARIAPQINHRLQAVKFSYESVSGRYVSNWKVNADSTVTVHVEVPFGCEAVLVLPGTNGEEIALTAGVFDRTYQPDCNYRQKYTMESRLEEMAEDESALQILKEDMPLAYGMIESRDGENLGMSLNELQTMFFMGFNPAMVQKAAARLCMLMVDSE